MAILKKKNGNIFLFSLRVKDSLHEIENKRAGVYSLVAKPRGLEYGGREFLKLAFEVGEQTSRRKGVTLRAKKLPQT